ncbi:MAG TPA: hypothetical protein VNS58_02445 [Puia sp.]|nr:hypothetical protein [Puia sp.]
MKQIYLYVVCLLCTLAAHAEKTPRAKAKKIVAVGGVQFKLNNYTSDTLHRDSALIIFDRADHTGAGVIYQVFYGDKDHNIYIPVVPAGKYYVTIQCLGMHRDRLEKVVYVKSEKNEKVKISLQDTEEFSKDKVVIPVYAPKFSDLAVLKMK